MEPLFWISYSVLWVALAFLGVLMLGTLRHIALLNWRMEQLQATTPSRTNRNGLRPGSYAPRFDLPDASGNIVSFPNHPSKICLLVFSQTGCGPCNAIAPDLEKLARRGDVNVVEVVNRNRETGEVMEQEGPVTYQRLFQTNFQVSKKYEAFATPFAFVIGADGFVRAAGIINSERHIRFLLGSAESEIGVMAAG